MGHIKNIPGDVWKRIDKKGEDDCWEWRGHKTRFGYGSMKISHRSYLVHRIVYELIHGPIPDGLLICHACDNPPCCNPTHLFIGTQRDNIKDMHIKGRASLRCGENCPTHKLTWVNINKIRKLYTDHIYNQTELGHMFGVKQNTISQIINYRRWVSTNE